MASRLILRRVEIYMENKIVIFTVMKDSDGTYRVFCRNRFASHSRFGVKDLFKTMSELTTLFNNEIGMGILFEIED